MNFPPSLFDLLEHHSLSFETGTYRYIDGKYIFDSHIPNKRECCGGKIPEGRQSFHRHGYYPRFLTTLIKSRISKVPVLNLRWQCPLCEATSSISPPNILYRQRICTLILFFLAWLYLNASGGIDRCYPPELDSVRERSQLRIYQRRLRETAQITQQSIREAILQRVGPEDYEQMTLSGLSPPESLRKCQTPTSRQIWGSLHLLEVSSHFLNVPLSLLLSRARERATLLRRPFLTQIR